MLAGSVGFVAIGLWFIIAPPTNGKFLLEPAKIMIAGFASVLFFGLCAFFLVRKLGDRKPGLVIDSRGLLDNSSGVSAGQILWSDIDRISVIEIHGQKLIMLQVTNPQHYIDKQTSGFKRKLMTMNYEMYGTPLSISSNGLKISFDELLSMWTNKLSSLRR
jgi:hypothetical protein